MTRKRYLVTGAAGFIGSHLCDRLLADGHLVRGVDRFSPSYDRSLKEANLAGCRPYDAFELIEADLARDDLRRIVADVDAVFHLAAQPGVRDSFGDRFSGYVADNVLATQRLFECLCSQGVPVVTASSSSVYGDADVLPMQEEGGDLRPVSPYGLTKLVTERLVDIYLQQRNLHAVVLRYFTVYGPRQRPDMAFTRLIRAALDGQTVHIFGDGQQSRDFTFVGDVVDATIRAQGAPAGRVYNIAGGEPTSLDSVVALLGELIDRPLVVVREPEALGDVRHTWADTTRAQRELGWFPQTCLRQGLEAQVSWLQSHLARSPAQRDGRPPVLEEAFADHEDEPSDEASSDARRRPPHVTDVSWRSRSV